MNIVDLDNTCLLCPMFKLSDVLSCLISWGVASLSKIRGRRGGGAGRDSNWWLSIDPCRKCHFIWWLKGMGFWLRGLKPSVPDSLWLRPLLRFTLDSSGTRIILIIGSTLMFFWGINEAPGNWKMEGRIQFAVILSQKVVSNFPK